MFIWKMTPLFYANMPHSKQLRIHKAFALWCRCVWGLFEGHNCLLLGEGSRRSHPACWFKATDLFPFEVQRRVIEVCTNLTVLDNLGRKLQPCYQTVFPDVFVPAYNHSPNHCRCDLEVGVVTAATLQQNGAVVFHCVPFFEAPSAVGLPAGGRAFELHSCSNPAHTHDHPHI